MSELNHCINASRRWRNGVLVLEKGVLLCTSPSINNDWNGMNELLIEICCPISDRSENKSSILLVIVG